MSDIQQGTDEWLLARCGFVGASRINDVMAKGRTAGSESETRKKYKRQIVAERISGVPSENFTNGYMQWGTENEPFARAAYEIVSGCMVDQVGFILHPEIKYTGASPDGLIDTDGLVEIKCPKTETHIDYALQGTPPTEYQNQMLWQMECTGRKWCDFVSFDPRLPESMRIFVVRFHRDDERIAVIKKEVLKFLDEVDETISKIRGVFKVTE